MEWLPLSSMMLALRIEGGILVGADGVLSSGKSNNQVVRFGADTHTAVRHTIYLRHPSQPKLYIVLMGIIAGELSLPSSEYSHHNALGRSLHVPNGNAVHFLVGLKSYSSDLSTANYYCWLCFFLDEESRGPGFWLNFASGGNKLEFVKKNTKYFHPDLTKSLQFQHVDGMLSSFTLRDCIPTVCSVGPFTLIGDATHPMSPCKRVLDYIELSFKQK